MQENGSIRQKNDFLNKKANDLEISVYEGLKQLNYMVQYERREILEI